MSERFCRHGLECQSRYCYQHVFASCCKAIWQLAGYVWRCWFFLLLLEHFHPITWVGWNAHGPRALMLLFGAFCVCLFP
jgi:hypothetical protein